VAKPVFVTASPAPSIISGDLTLEAGAWYGHIHVRHPEVVLWQLQDTLSDPDYICSSTTVQGAFVFICEGNTDDEYGDPLVVTVLPQADGSNIVTTAYYDENYLRHQPKVWSKM
jgi:hypothetical protein